MTQTGPMEEFTTLIHGQLYRYSGKYTKLKNKGRTCGTGKEGRKFLVVFVSEYGISATTAQAVFNFVSGL